MSGSDLVPDAPPNLEQSSDGFLQVDPDWRIVSVDAAGIRALERPGLAGKSLWAVFAGLENSVFGDACRRAR